MVGTTFRPSTELKAESNINIISKGNQLAKRMHSQIGFNKLIIIIIKLLKKKE